MKPDFKAAWEPRIGPEATLYLWNARQFMPYFWISWAAGFATILVVMATRSTALWLSILVSITILVWVFFAVLASWTYSRRRKRAARGVYEYLGRPPQLPKSIFPPVMLRDTVRFDNCMVVRGIPQRGDYVSQAAPEAYAIAERKKAKN